MARIGKTILDMRTMRTQWEALMAEHGQSFGTASSTPSGDGPRLQEIPRFGANPGELRMMLSRPENPRGRVGLVVALHGCTQNAQGFAHGSGWVALGRELGFGVLLPEQRPQNNPKTCFSWFHPADTRRGEGEVRSIREMVAACVDQGWVDPARIFVTGLSAGGAMAASLLATYPDVFAAGAIVAGLPHGVASDVRQALDAMARGSGLGREDLAARVRSASDHGGPWPRVSVWHGDSDHTVAPVNGRDVVAQWTALHGMPDQPTTQTREDGATRRLWRGRDGRPAVEHVTIPRLGHGLPVGPGDGALPGGEPGAFFLPAGIASTVEIARFFGLADEEALRRTPSRPRSTGPADRDLGRESGGGAPGRPAATSRPADIAGVITRALKAAGLSR